MAVAPVRTRETVAGRHGAKEGYGGSMEHASLYGFDPRQTALRETQLWEAYYDRHWMLAMRRLVQLLRSQFGLGLAQAMRAAFWGTLAGIAWKPRRHDVARVKWLIKRFYRVLRAATAARFSLGAAAEAELRYWSVHRALSGLVGSPELVDALAAISTAVYGLAPERVRPAAEARARACDLVDEITAGLREPALEAWSAVTEALCEAYTRLKEELPEAGRIGAGGRGQRKVMQSF